MKKWTFQAIIFLVVVLGPPGCTDPQRREIDRIIADVNQVGQGIAAAAHGPAAPLIPPELRLIMELVGIATAGAYGTWQTMRNRRLNGQLNGLSQVAKAP